MRKLFIILAVLLGTAGMRAEEHSYVWNAEFPNYKQQIPSSDFTTASASPATKPKASADRSSMKIRMQDCC